MFWKIVLSLFMGFFVTAETEMWSHAVSTRSAVENNLDLSQQKQILEWNLARNKEILGDESNQRILVKIEKIKKQDHRLFMEQTKSSPRREIKLRLSQENINDRKKHL